MHLVYMIENVPLDIYELLKMDLAVLSYIRDENF